MWTDTLLLFIILSFSGQSVGKLWREESQSVVINVLNPQYLDKTQENRHTYDVENFTKQVWRSDLLHLEQNSVLKKSEHCQSN